MSDIYDIMATNPDLAAPLLVPASQPYALIPNATDPENDPLTFSIEGLPSWASFDSSTGSMTGTPDATDIGATYYITITVSDGNKTTPLHTLELLVTS